MKETNFANEQVENDPIIRLMSLRDKLDDVVTNILPEIINHHEDDPKKTSDLITKINDLKDKLERVIKSQTDSALEYLEGEKHGGAPAIEDSVDQMEKEYNNIINLIDQEPNNQNYEF